MRKVTWKAIAPPNGWYEIDKGHPLAQGLVGLFLPSTGIGMTNLVIDQPQTLMLGTFGSGPSGLAAHSWQGQTTESDTLNFTAGPFTVAVWEYLTDVGTSAGNNHFGRWTYVNETNSQGWAIVSKPASLNWSFRVLNNNGAANYDACPGGTRTNGDHFVLGRVDASYRNIWVDGVDITYSTKNLTTPGGSLVTGNSTWAGAERAWAYACYCWERYLQDEEIKWLNVEPLAFLRKISWQTQGPLGSLVGSAMHFPITY